MRTARAAMTLLAKELRCEFRTRELLTREAAQAIRQGRADAGLGLLAAARGAGLASPTAGLTQPAAGLALPTAGLDFIPLFQERIDLVLEANEMGTPPIAELREFLNSAEGRTLIASIEGYDTAHSGEMLTP